MIRLLVLISLSALSACASRPAPRFLSPSPPRATDVSALIAQGPLAAGENVRPTELGRASNVSVSLVQIRDREQPHIHQRYDLTVTLVRGEGTLWLNGTPLPVHAGDVSFIPKGTPHYFVNESAEPAASIVVFSPPFSGPDQQPVPSN